MKKCDYCHEADAQQMKIGAPFERARIKRIVYELCQKCANIDSEKNDDPNN